jgi:hypothetical protein
MRKLTISLATTAMLAMPVMASANGFDTTITAPVTTSVKLDIKLSDDLAYRANNLPEKISDRGAGARSLRAGFAANGFYGEKSLNQLLDEIQDELSEDFERKGIMIDENAPITLSVTLEDVKNNRPTFEQLSRQPGLSFDSVGIGGAELSGELVGETGESLGTLSYSWYESGLEPYNMARTNGVWTDARRAISRFSRKTAKALS